MKICTRILKASLVLGVLLYGGAIALLAGAASAAFGGEPCAWLALTVGSKHLGETSSKNYNEQNWGLGSEHCIGKLVGVEFRGAAGFYRNSNRIDSFYFGGSASVPVYGPAHAGVALLRVSGYEFDPVTAPVPVLSIEGRQLGGNLSYLPKTKHNAGAIGAQLKWRWR